MNLILLRHNCMSVYLVVNLISLSFFVVKKAFISEMCSPFEGSSIPHLVCILHLLTTFEITLLSLTNNTPNPNTFVLQKPILTPLFPWRQHLSLVTACLPPTIPAMDWTILWWQHLHLPLASLSPLKVSKFLLSLLAWGGSWVLVLVVGLVEGWVLIRKVYSYSKIRFWNRCLRMPISG